MSDLTVLDCTFRDGGYYNSWDFDRELVCKYLSAMQAAKVDVLEMGFRFTPKNEFLGAHAFTTDSYLGNLPLPSGSKIGVMINAADYVDDPELINAFFDKKNNSPVSLVRIAAHYKHIPQCRYLCENLKALGYAVGLNLMQSSGKTHEELHNSAKTIYSWNNVDVLYFADSLGNMNIEEVQSITNSLSSGWSGNIGIHTHNNKGMGLVNTIAAVIDGVRWVDGTVLGMGRGAGNTCTEQLLVELADYGYGYDVEALLPLALNEFESLRKKYEWGPNILYFLSATYGIHPTYIQQMQSDLGYSSDQILTGLKNLKNKSAKSYSYDNLTKAINGCEELIEGSWNATGWINDKNVLILGSGPSTRKYKNEIERFIKKFNPYVICLNTQTSIDRDLISCYVACNYTRIMTELDVYRELKNRDVIMPKSVFPESLYDEFDKLGIKDYGIQVKKDEFCSREKSCTIPHYLVINYVLAILEHSNCGIYICGFDGYGRGDRRQEEMLESLSLYGNADKLVSITPTTYPVKIRSVFSI